MILWKIHSMDNQSVGPGPGHIMLFYHVLSHLENFGNQHITRKWPETVAAVATSVVHPDTLPSYSDTSIHLSQAHQAIAIVVLGTVAIKGSLDGAKLRGDFSAKQIICSYTKWPLNAKSSSIGEYPGQFSYRSMAIDGKG